MHDHDYPCLTPAATGTARRQRALVTLACLALLAACGGGPASDTAAPPTMLASSTTFELAIPVLPATVMSAQMQPAFHAAPMLLDAPDRARAGNASALAAPHRQSLEWGMEAVPTRGLTPAGIVAARRSYPHLQARPTQQADDLTGADAPSGATDPLAPMAAGTQIATYTPAQIRAAYGLAALPAPGSALSAAQAAQLGAGQTIYIVDAMHNPNTAAELAAFNQRFSLPTCATRTLAPGASLPLAAPSATACELVVVYSTAAGGMTATAPAYDAGWATEIALDVQWAHATAPLARLVVIEAADASVNSLLGGIRLANAMGPGAVSMSFGGAEGSWTATADSAFTGTAMTYLAATGDSGAGVSWPAVSTRVLAVGGTTLTYSGSGARSEAGWSGTGGGTSAYTALPAYQSSTVPGMGSAPRRNVADVAFNADPASGQYVAVMAPGAGAVSWISAGGTSLATPQWAGVVAIANARRAQLAKAPLGAPHTLLYGQIATQPASYAAAFADITKGQNGSCATCISGTGYDILSGLGTPNLGSLLGLMAEGSAVTAPQLTAATINGVAGTPLAFTISAVSANALTFSLAGAPAGMLLGSGAAVTWAAPVAGTYAVTVTATDAKSALSAKALYTVIVTAPAAPLVTAATINGKAGTALAFTVTASAANPLTFSLSGAPAGMTIGATGVVSWPAPLVGTYAVTVAAKDSKTGLIGRATSTVVITAQAPPQVASASISGVPTVALSFKVAVSAANPVTLTLVGAPAGMAISSAGLLSWALPLAGTYSVTVVARDSKTGLSGQGVYTIKIAAAGPVIAVTGFSGVLGKPMSGVIAISDPGASAISVTLRGVPMGMGFAISGTTLTASWAAPQAGTYSIVVNVTDNLGRSAQATVPVKIGAP